MTNFKDLVINSDEKLCYLKGNPIKLTKSEYNILSFILNNRNKIFSREELINNAWKEPVTNRAVDTAISRLRKKLVNIVLILYLEQDLVMVLQKIFNSYRESGETG